MQSCLFRGYLSLIDLIPPVYICKTIVLKLRSPGRTFSGRKILNPWKTMKPVICGKRSLIIAIMEVFVFAFLLPEFYLFCVHDRVTDPLMTSKSESFLRSANDGACLIEKIQRKWLLNFITAGILYRQSGVHWLWSNLFTTRFPCAFNIKNLS